MAIALFGEAPNLPTISRNDTSCIISKLPKDIVLRSLGAQQRAGDSTASRSRDLLETDPRERCKM